MDEDDKDFIKIDFADKYIGGYTIGPGLVQEEIRFITAPEHIVAMLIAEKLEDDECLIMTGCEKFSSYSGYSKSFKFKGNYIDRSSHDTLGRKHNQWIAMDAQSYHSNPESQFEAKNIIRDLNKSYCAFSASNTNQSAIATGNWGCGIFRGNAHLKVNETTSYYTTYYTRSYIPHHSTLHECFNGISVHYSNDVCSNGAQRFVIFDFRRQETSERVTKD